MAPNAASQTLLSRSAQAGLLGCGLFATIGLFSPGLVLPQIERAYASTPHAELLTQLIGAVASFAFAVAAPFAGTLISRVGCRRVIVPALVLFALLGTAPVFLDDLRAMVATRVLLGLALAGIYTGGLAGIGALSELQRSRMFGWFSVVGGAAAIALFPVVGTLARIDWHLAFTVHVIALAIVPLALQLPTDLGIAPARPLQAARGTLALLTPAMLGLLILAGLAGMTMFLPPMYSPLYLASVGITDTRVLAIPVTLGSIAAVLAAAAYGYAHGRLGVRGVSAATLLVMGIALLIAGSVTSIPQFTVAIVVQSAMLALIAPNVSATALAVSEAEQGSQAIGLANGVMFGSQLLFPFIASAVRSATSLAGVFLAFGGASLAIGIVICLSAIRRRSQAAAISTSAPD